MRPTEVGEVVAAFSAADPAPEPEIPADLEAAGEALLTPDMLLMAGVSDADAPAGAADAEAWGDDETAAAAAPPAMPEAPPVAFEVQQWPELPQDRPQLAQPATLGLLYDVPLTVRAELGRTQRRVEDIITLGPGSVIDLDRMVGDMVDIYANGQWVAKGEVVVVEENFGVRITEIGTASERVSKLRLREGS